MHTIRQKNSAPRMDTVYVGQPKEAETQEQKKFIRKISAYGGDFQKCLSLELSRRLGEGLGSTGKD